MGSNMLDILSKYKSGALTFRDAGCIKYIKGDTLLNVSGDEWSEARIENCAIDVPFGLLDFPIACDVDGGNYIHPDYIIKKCSHLESLISIETKEPKRTKVEYEQEKSFKEVLKCAIDGEVFYSKDGKGEFKFDASRLLFVNHSGADVDISHLTEHCFYRRIETPIDERQEFIDFVEKLGSDLSADEWSFACLAAEMFDSGRVKLLEQGEWYGAYKRKYP